MKLQINDEVIVKNSDYYGGEGKIRDIKKWNDGRLMLAIYFSGKGTVWFDERSEFISKAPKGMFDITY